MQFVFDFWGASQNEDSNAFGRTETRAEMEKIDLIRVPSITFHATY
jgi:hypothetical protein